MAILATLTVFTRVGEGTGALVSYSERYKGMNMLFRESTRIIKVVIFIDFQ